MKKIFWLLSGIGLTAVSSTAHAEGRIFLSSGDRQVSMSYQAPQTQLSRLKMSSMKPSTACLPTRNPQKIALMPPPKIITTISSFLRTMSLLLAVLLLICLHRLRQALPRWQPQEQRTAEVKAAALCTSDALCNRQGIALRHKLPLICTPPTAR